MIKNNSLNAVFGDFVSLSALNGSNIVTDKREGFGMLCDKVMVSPVVERIT